MKYFLNMIIIVSFILIFFQLCPKQISANPEILLLNALKEGNIGLVQEAIDAGADVNARVRYWEDDTWTPLMVAAKRGYVKSEYIEIAELLLAHGAAVNMKSDDGMTPLMRAKGSGEMIHLLLKHGADVHATDNEGITALGHAAAAGKNESAMILINAGADIYRRTASGKTLLILAAQAATGEDPSFLEYLIERGLDVNAQDNVGYTPLMAAIEHPSIEIVELLLRYGADPNVSTIYENTTPLMVAANKGEVEIGRVLLEHGANVQGKVGQRVLAEVLYGGFCSVEFIALLGEYKVNALGAECEE